MKWLLLPLQAGKAWNGDTIYHDSLGGSESAVAYLARDLVRAGENVTVLTHGKAGVFDDVTYVGNDQQENLGRIQWDVVVSSRWPQVLEMEWKTKTRMLWLHDLPSQNLMARTSRIVFISEYQRSQYYMNDNNIAKIIGDGVGEEFLDVSAERSDNRLIWTSNPDRGLPIAAHIFQSIRKCWPELELHVYGRFSTYGWDVDSEQVYLPRPCDREGVVLHDSLPRKALALEIAKSWAFFYPTCWPETFCMAALEAQACGTPVIAPPFGALNETVKGGVLTYDFLNAVSQLRNKRRWEKLSVLGIEQAQQYSWAKIAQQWIKEAHDACTIS
jgi:glycosyltransferase involved in cell wall biosynthesis